MIIRSVLTKHFKTNSLYKTPSQALGGCFLEKPSCWALLQTLIISSPCKFKALAKVKSLKKQTLSDC